MSYATDTTNTKPQMNKTQNRQEMTFVVSTPQSEKFKNASGRQANIIIATAYHHDAVAQKSKEKKIFVSHATITTKDGKTTVHFFISKTANAAEVEKKVREGFEKLCAGEKIHLAKAEKDRGGIKCWFSHKYEEYMKWAKTKWQNMSHKSSKN